MTPPAAEKTAPRLSVLLPVRNGAATLRTALKSVLLQTFGDFEILLLDDGSSDGSMRIAEGLDDQRIRCLGDSVPKGLTFRLNQGISLARGRYIARMDADDVSFADRFELQIAFLETHDDVDLVGCRAVAFRNAGHDGVDADVIGLLPFAGTHEALCARPWNNIPLPHPGWMGRVDWFRKHLYRVPEVMRAEDQELLLRASTDSRYACLEEVLLGYRQGPYDRRRTWLARRALLAAQSSIFIQRRQWRHLFLATAVSAVKVVIDLVAALPGSDRLWFARMGAPVDVHTRRRLHQALLASGEPATTLGFGA